MVDIAPITAAGTGLFTPTTQGLTLDSAQAFVAVYASLGHQSMQTPARLGVVKAANLVGDSETSGKPLPLAALAEDPLPGTTASVTPPAILPLPIPATASPDSQARSSMRADGSVVTPTQQDQNRGKLAPAIARIADDALGELRSTTHLANDKTIDTHAPSQTRLLSHLLTERVEIAVASSNPTPSPSASLTNDSSAFVHTLAATASGAPVGEVQLAQSSYGLQHPRFTDAFSQQVTLMASNGVQQARISLNPPDLGPVELRIVMRNDEAAVHLASQHLAVREVLEDALPRLREHFDLAGMRLSDSGVFEHLPRQATQENNGQDSSQLPEYIDEEDFHDHPHDARLPTRQHGLIDAYI